MQAYIIGCSYMCPTCTQSYIACNRMIGGRCIVLKIRCQFIGGRIVTQKIIYIYVCQFRFRSAFARIGITVTPPDPVLVVTPVPSILIHASKVKFVRCKEISFPRLAYCCVAEFNAIEYGRSG